MLSLTTYANHQTELAKITQNIQIIQIDLKEAHAKKQHLQKKLKNTEIAESHLTHQLHDTKAKLTQQRHQLSHLDYQSNQVSEKIDTHQSMLKKQVQLTYFLSRQPAIKYLLDTHSLQQYQHTAIYFDYLAHAQLQTITHLKSTFNGYQKSKHAQENTLLALLTIQKKQITNEHTLQQTQAISHQLIDSINHHIKTREEKLAALLRNKKRLEATLEDLNKRQLDPSLFHHAFASLQGKLLWPVEGQLIHHYGAPIGQSELRWDGVLIEAPSGKPVYAVAPGKVIFAKWLEGYGLLLIIEHGKGYMTLYGRNQSLLKKVGDWVTPNMVIASVGQTSDFSKSALYFSIRRDAKPINPEIWCHTALLKPAPKHENGTHSS